MGHINADAIPGYPYSDVANALSAWSFATVRGDRLRTVGLCFALQADSPRLDQWGPAEAQALNRLIDPLRANESAAARGKVAFIESGVQGERRVACYQAKGNSAEAVFCGNATAAALASCHVGRSRTSTRLEVVCSDTTIEVQASTAIVGSRYAVTQEWTLPGAFTITQQSNRAESFLLNPYLLLRGPLSEQAIGEAYEAFRTTYGLRAKLVVIHNTDGYVKAAFYNSNGRHGAAPLTGLVTLGFLRTEVEWLSGLLRDNEIVTPAGPEEIPAVSVLTDRAVARLPEVQVELHQLQFIRVEND